MKETQILAPKGLEGVVVGETRISHVDGEQGSLIYRGRSIHELVDEPFDRVVHLVLTGELGDFDAQLCAAGELSAREADLVLSLPEATHPMHVIQGLTPLLDRTDHFTEFGDAAQGLSIAAKLPQLMATHLQRRLVAYPSEGRFLDRFLAQIDAPANSSAPFSITQILQLEHSFNASTFTARVVASTEAPIEDCLSAAFGALHGRLHGGADQAALEAADEVGEPSKAAAFVDACIANKRKVMGMGHREYKVVDPRSRHVKKLAAELTADTEHERTFKTLLAIEDRFRERMAENGKELHANLEFYKGLVYRAIGLPTRFFTAGFAMSRVYGYIAHFVENAEDSRIIRPAACYVGKLPETEGKADAIPA